MSGASMSSVVARSQNRRGRAHDQNECAEDENSETWHRASFVG
jgi:hypothetical protein